MINSDAELRIEIELLRSELKELRTENGDLEVLIENVTSHSDLIESQLFLVNRQLKVEICDRQEKEVSLRISEALLRAINKSLQREKADLELVLEATTEHGDLVESLLFNRGQLEQEELFQAITQALPDGIMLARPNDWAILFANSAAVQLLDLPTEQIIGVSWAEFCQPGNDLKQLQILFDLQGHVQNFELPLKQQYQGNLWINISLHILKLANQSVILISCQDISKRRETQDALQRSQMELKQHAELLEIRVRERTAALQDALELAARANKYKSQFLANVSHELRTPLNAILGFSQFLQQDESLNPDQQESVNLISQSSEHLLVLINDVLELSKIESGSQALKEQTFDLTEELTRIWQMLQPRSLNKGIELRLEISEDVPKMVVSDRGKLAQVLINLINNGIKFTEKGSVTLRIYLDSPLLRNKVDLNFEVIDTGVGISPSESKLLFQEFVQTESGKLQKEGTGLGLVISQKFVRLMGGEITVASILNSGSIFSFSLNLAIPPDAASKATSSLSKPDSHDFPPEEIAIDRLPPLKILIAEDNAVNLKIALRMIEKLGYKADFCRNGNEALAAHQANNYELIFMDVQMPELDGMEATRAIRLLEQNKVLTSSVIIIAMTAFGLAEDRRDCLDAGMDDYISKPVRQAELQTILNHWHRIVKKHTKSIEL
jgi:PAS domain S-box-containing protein